MFTKIASFAAATLIVATVAPPAHAFRLPNGVELNGVELNGQKINGQKINGQKVNGQKLNGQKVNGRSFQGTSPGVASFAIDAIELPTTR